VQRYVRVASPAQGTRLASGNLDLFLSGMLTLIGQVPFFFGSPFYSAFKRVVWKSPTSAPTRIWCPASKRCCPIRRWRACCATRRCAPGIEMAVIAGDIEGGNLLKRLGVLLTDFLLFDNVDNDLVVDSDSMFAGIAPQARARALFDRGADVSHFRYFTNIDTRALRCATGWSRPTRLPLDGFPGLAGSLPGAVRRSALAPRPRAPPRRRRRPICRWWSCCPG
jgi:hypothetical protein